MATSSVLMLARQAVYAVSHLYRRHFVVAAALNKESRVAIPVRIDFDIEFSRAQRAKGF